MNVADYTYLINNPEEIGEKQTIILGNVLDEFPFFQSARALRLKGLYNENSFRYNFALKVTAAHTTDRSVLFDFITSTKFTAIQHAPIEKETPQLLENTAVESQTIEKDKQLNTLEQSIVDSVKKAQIIEETNLPAPVKQAVKDDTKNIEETTIVEEKTKTEKETLEAKLEIGKPLDFSRSEKHSFQEWLEISRAKPIEREETTEVPTKTIISDPVKEKKAKLIDKFIETSPKISPVKQTTVSPVSFDLNKEDNSSLMTETLARVYLEQKKYQKAIQAYEILILKYPEKSSFFVDRISDVKILQHNNN
jgi:tetratricopeptide (TPR) repeat protein